MSRTEYFREYRRKNPDKIQEIKQKYYHNYPEKHRQWSRNYYHQTKNKPDKGKVVARAGLIAGWSATTAYRITVIRNYGSEEISKRANDEKISIYKAFLLVRAERKQASKDLMILFIKGKKFSDQNMIPIFKKYPNLKRQSFE